MEENGAEQQVFKKGEREEWIFVSSTSAGLLSFSHIHTRRRYSSPMIFLMFREFPERASGTTRPSALTKGGEGSAGRRCLPGRNITKNKAIRAIRIVLSISLSNLSLSLIFTHYFSLFMLEDACTYIRISNYYNISTLKISIPFVGCFWWIGRTSPSIICLYYLIKID